ncbi:GntR family transcriptional regulator [Mumia sp. zg.B53]|uniref:GntR family transcriptional regulator n=1 Tax=unclassified Mumia TaxID=2621872 RepID=UPI001C6E7CB3|nr:MULTISPECIES: GntR family transcriptional regulator [unclassified Mumia]MBW9204769.1 GntR family transcriptional regulator [Mumia sp. zg.B17]MBW9209226.1 GntR family transcriptional regulator [Mumia sp. zg.B21]MBW9213836.1 GntR family transcriptional regulator [Mumia sp. zg.B53]MDD9349034.1 GntR family transcriptional regulator [Mumia sp.]
MRIVIDPDVGEPPYEQVRRQIASQAADGTLGPGARIPTVRALAHDLGLAVNTVAKAYRALEAEGVVETLGRRGTFVRTSVMTADVSRAAAAAADAYVSELRRLGLARTEGVRMVEDRWL